MREAGFPAEQTHYALPKPNAGRLTTATQMTKEQQTRPGALDHKPLADLVVLPSPGGALLFSGAQLHTSIPNTSERARYSIDFHTVDATDLLAGRGAPGWTPIAVE